MLFFPPALYRINCYDTRYQPHTWKRLRSAYSLTPAPMPCESALPTIHIKDNQQHSWYIVSTLPIIVQQSHSGLRLLLQWLLPSYYSALPDLYEHFASNNRYRYIERCCRVCCTERDRSFYTEIEGHNKESLFFFVGFSLATSRGRI